MSETERHVLGHFGAEGGYKAGSFTTKLMEAYQNADPGNRYRVSLGFPDLARAMDTVMNEADGIKILQDSLKAETLGKPSWNQPLCGSCWTEEHGELAMPARLQNAPAEKCCMCGQITHLGIWIRRNPATVNHPRMEEED